MNRVKFIKKEYDNTSLNDTIKSELNKELLRFPELNFSEKKYFIIIVYTMIKNKNDFNKFSSYFSSDFARILVRGYQGFIDSCYRSKNENQNITEEFNSINRKITTFLSKWEEIDKELFKFLGSLRLTRTQGTGIDDLMDSFICERIKVIKEQYKSTQKGLKELKNRNLLKPSSVISRKAKSDNYRDLMIFLVKNLYNNFNPTFKPFLKRNKIEEIINLIIDNMPDAYDVMPLVCNDITNYTKRIS